MQQNNAVKTNKTIAKKCQKAKKHRTRHTLVLHQDCLSLQKNCSWMWTASTYTTPVITTDFQTFHLRLRTVNTNGRFSFFVDVSRTMHNTLLVTVLLLQTFNNLVTVSSPVCVVYKKHAKNYITLSHWELLHNSPSLGTIDLQLSLLGKYYTTPPPWKLYKSFFLGTII